MDKKNYDAMIALEKTHWWFSARRRVLKKTMERFFRNEKFQDVLEIGCGSGGNLKFLSGFGKIHGSELDEISRKFANKRNLCKVFYGKLPDDINTSKKFDLICIFDVLEHVDKDSDSLKKINELLNNNGYLVITVPAFMFLWSEHDVSSHHKRRYRKAQLANLLKVNGFQLEFISYFNFFLFPLIALIRLLQRLFKFSSKNNDVKKEIPIKNFLLKSIFSVESFFMPYISLPFGVSLISIVKKPE